MIFRNTTKTLQSALFALLLGTTPLCAQEQVDYTKQIKPIFKERCYACHGALKQEASLRLDTAQLMQKGGDSGAAVTPGKINTSVLIERITEQDESLRMPPEGQPLTAEQIKLIETWIKQGAQAPANEQPEADPRDHWAFRKPIRPAVPQGKGIPAETNPIDAFILARLGAAKFQPRPKATKAILLRRLYIDLIGLPPTPAELQAFESDQSPDAWNNVVDKLLADPRYGERWARHWMDIWRYADWYGRRNVPDVWNSAPQIWRWRDWIVKSLNSDKGYDRMVAEMLAADEISPEDREAGYATGFLIRNWYALNPNEWMRANVEHTGKAFLGLRFNCAHCHDHKYDPITNDEYFQLRAFFEPIYIRQEQVPGEVNPGPYQDYVYLKLRKIQKLGAVRIFDKNPKAPTWFYTGGDERNRVKERGSIPPGVPALLSDIPHKIEEIKLPTRAWYPGLQPEIQQTALNFAKDALSNAQNRLNELKKSPATVPAEATKQLAQAEAAYAAALKKAKASSQQSALSGQHSLLLDATTGRRIVQNTGHVQMLKALPDGARFEFQVRILEDAHFNFQLARDINKGLTASLIAFEGGNIIAYQPGGFTHFHPGKYDFRAGQNHFQVSIVLKTAEDRCLLTVQSLSDDKRLVDQVPISLNGWNPVGDATKAITFDARTGSVAVVDDVFLVAPGKPASDRSNHLLHFDFEPPKYTEGLDIPGIEGWVISPHSVKPAYSVVSQTAGNSELNKLLNQVKAAKRVIESATRPLRSAEARFNAAQAELESIHARIAADRAKYGETPNADTVALARKASQLERKAILLKQESNLLIQQQALATAEAKPASDKKRAQEIKAAKAQLTTTQAALQKARIAASDTKSEKYTGFSQTYPKTSTGRRKALAEWLVSQENPLTARVAINHIWLRHFNRAIVESVYDFGRNGKTPSHPKLLDWLAVELMEHNWSMKHVHRLIVTSDAYQRVTSQGDESHAAAKQDPENYLLWRMNASRMEAEVLRDSLLYVADKLDLTMGGQPLENPKALTTFRRSLYYEVYPEGGGSSQLGELFDAPNPLDCYRRTESIVPQQALALTNSTMVHDLSQKIVTDWEKKAGKAANNHDRFVQDMFVKILSRRPINMEQQACLSAIEKQQQIFGTAKHAKPQSKARASIVRALLNHNDFITVR